jgi:hypothetical protein
VDSIPQSPCRLLLEKRALGFGRRALQLPNPSEVQLVSPNVNAQRRWWSISQPYIYLPTQRQSFVLVYAHMTHLSLDSDHYSFSLFRPLLQSESRLPVRSTAISHPSHPRHSATALNNSSIKTWRSSQPIHPLSLMTIMGQMAFSSLLEVWRDDGLFWGSQAGEHHLFPLNLLC